MQHALISIRRLLATTWPSLLVAVVAWISIVVAIDPAGSYPNMPEGPGLTVDEIFNVEQGVLLVEQARALGWFNLIPGVSVEAFKPENGYLPDHPPLGRYWLGVHHHLTWWLAPPFDPEGFCVTACARTGSATAFALTVWMIGLFATAHYGRAAGLLTSLALVLMPRVYGHAHLASLETITNLTCTAAVLAVAHWWSGSASGCHGHGFAWPCWRSRATAMQSHDRGTRPKTLADANGVRSIASTPSSRVALLTGVMMGLALLTKIQAVLIPIPVILWALWRWRTKAILPLLIWGVTANVVFFALWPYLWLDPIGHFLEYLGRTTNRATIHCFYFGVRYDDKAVPWHYPFVMFAVTVPVGLHLLGVWGLFSLFGRQPPARIPNTDATPSGGRESSGSSGDPQTPRSTKAPLTLTFSPEDGGEGTRSRDVLLLACTVFPLIVFALPGVAVYDGERLFLTSFPLWAILAGRGTSRLCEFIVHRADNLITLLTAAVAMSLLLFYHLAWQVGLRPCHLCYYNELTLGQVGAARAGLELDYWGVGATRTLLTELAEFVPSNSHVATTPTLHQFQADEYRRQSPILRRRGISTVSYESLAAPPSVVLVFRRRADLSNPWTDGLSENVFAWTPSRHKPGRYFVWLAYVIQEGPTG